MILDAIGEAVMQSASRLRKHAGAPLNVRFDRSVRRHSIQGSDGAWLVVLCVVGSPLRSPAMVHRCGTGGAHVVVNCVGGNTTRTLCNRLRQRTCSLRSRPDEIPGPTSHVSNRMRRKFLLVTANVGSLFEKSCRIHDGWLKKLIEEVQKVSADFVAIHMQEVGGKNYEECSSQVPPLVHKMAADMDKLGYSTGRAYLDLEFEVPDKYNALGSLFFAVDAVLPRIEQYDFEEKRYMRMEKGFEMVLKDLAACSKLRKAKFPKHFWPAIKWGRKGYIHCRFRHNETPVDFVNVHLFHDESNIALIHENPSLYSDNRKRALNYVLEEANRVSENNLKQHPLFIFGDLNFRLDSPSFLNRITVDADQRHDSLDLHGSLEGNAGSLLTVEAAAKQLQNGPSEDQQGEQLRRTVSAIEFRRSPNGSRTDIPSSCVLRIEKNRFDYFNHKKLLHEWRTYLEDDKEAKSFPSLRELRIQFPPTYPWSENPDESEALMKTRAPAWCDRVLMNTAAFEMVCADEHAIYDSIGKNVCMGDHKPVILSFTSDV
uniref:inositol-polyphosphate 5-phosphatase n=1 Tax=Parascaris univalens TaxID=6257 RepID=A0A915AHL1_PARUN